MSLGCRDRGNSAQAAQIQGLAGLLLRTEPGHEPGLRKPAVTAAWAGVSYLAYFFLLGQKRKNNRVRGACLALLGNITHDWEMTPKPGHLATSIVTAGLRLAGHNADPVTRPDQNGISSLGSSPQTVMPDGQSTDHPRCASHRSRHVARSGSQKPRHR